MAPPLLHASLLILTTAPTPTLALPSLHGLPLIGLTTQPLAASFIVLCSNIEKSVPDLTCPLVDTVIMLVIASHQGNNND
ncbi:hypothetical protein E2C01_076328 [Portunus trituberculatus]|uniref:Secreted protein n=1 Tax=Portunus trituberculatus TaxID=210409 RepID=A0A5B7IJI1_PORTR|nr:hypothetical protein [Portunus trituberculatus]